MVEVIHALNDYIVIVVIAIAVVSVVIVKAIASVVGGVSRERSRREIAAYIAEGSMTPEQGERLMKAGEQPKERA